MSITTNSSREERNSGMFIEKRTTIKAVLRQANDYSYGIKSDAFTAEFIEGERLRLGPLFDMYYGAKPYDSDVSWYTYDMFQTSQYATEFFVK